MKNDIDILQLNLEYGQIIKFNSKLSAGARNSTLSSLASCKMSLKYSDVVFFEISVKVLLTYF